MEYIIIYDSACVFILYRCLSQYLFHFWIGTFYLFNRKNLWINKNSSMFSRLLNEICEIGLVKTSPDST